MGSDRIALFGKCLSRGDFVPRVAPVPVNDRACVYFEVAPGRSLENLSEQPALP